MVHAIAICRTASVIILAAVPLRPRLTRAPFLNSQLMPKSSTCSKVWTQAARFRADSIMLWIACFKDSQVSWRQLIFWTCVNNCFYCGTHSVPFHMSIQPTRNLIPCCLVGSRERRKGASEMCMTAMRTSNIWPLMDFLAIQWTSPWRWTLMECRCSNPHNYPPCGQCILWSTNCPPIWG